MGIFFDTVYLNSPGPAVGTHMLLCPIHWWGLRCKFYVPKREFIHSQPFTRAPFYYTVPVLVRLTKSQKPPKECKRARPGKSNWEMLNAILLAKYRNSMAGSAGTIRTVAKCV